MTLVEFLKKFRPGGPWVLTAIVPYGGIETKTFSDPKKAVAWVMERDGKANLYYMVNPAKRPLTKKAKKSDVAALEWLHVDVDDPSDEALARLRAFDPPPTVIIMSGGGYNAYWRLAEPVPVAPENTEELEAYNKGLIAPLGGDPACWNIDRILRLPGTMNLPTKKKRAADRKPVRSYIVNLNDQEHPLSAFQPARGPSTSGTAVVPGVNHTALPANLPEVDLGAVPLDMRWKIILRRGYDPGDPDLWPSRSEAMFAATCTMVRAGMSDELIASALLDPDLGISEHVRDQPNPRRYAARQIRRAREKVHDLG